MSSKTYRVKQVAELSGVTVRTLHHYDHIGLLQPQRRSSAGYRLYVQSDLLLLQQILIYRELGLGLSKIKQLICAPAFDRRAVLREQRNSLQAKAAQFNTMIRAIDAALAAIEDPKAMNPTDLFNGFNPKQYEEEAEQRWGHSKHFKESAKRTKGYSKDDWRRIKTATDDLMQRIAAAHQNGHAPNSPTAMDLAEEHRQQISQYYYPCSLEIHAGLGKMYIADSRFRENIDKYGEGLSEFLAGAIAANYQRAAK